MSFDLQKILTTMGPFALAIAGVLLAMGISSGAVLLERLWTYRRARLRSRAFSELAAQLLQQHDHPRLVSAAGEHRGSPLAQLIGAGMRTYLRATQLPSKDISAIELTRRALARETDLVSASLKRGLGVLASVGSVAPFVGLLGTVVGIISAFEGIAREGSGGLGAVSAGIAEALVETAFGLVVAIPSVLIFNYLTTRSDGIMLAVDQAKGELIDHLESHGRVEPPHPQAEVQSDPPALAARGMIADAS